MDETADDAICRFDVHPLLDFVKELVGAQVCRAGYAGMERRPRYQSGKPGRLSTCCLAAGMREIRISEVSDSGYARTRG